MNLMILVGRIKEMPVFEQTNSGLTYCHLLVETVPTDDKQPETFSVTLWKNAAETLREKGANKSLVCVKGRLKANNYLKDDGTISYKAELVAERLLFFD